MTAARQTLTSELRDSVDAVRGVVEQILDALQRSPGPAADRTEVDVLRRSFGVVGALSTQLNEAAALLVASQSRAKWERRFSSEFWPDRRKELHEQLQSDRHGGTTAWLEAWIGALISGVPEELERLVAEPFVLADWGVWLPDRCAAVQDAVAAAAFDPGGAVERLSDLFDVMMPGSDPDPEQLPALSAEPSTYERLAHAAAGGRVHLCLVLTRILARAGDSRAIQLVSTARKLLSSTDPVEEAQHLRSIAATESFIDRYQPSPEQVRSRWIDSMRSAAAGDLGCLLEYLIRYRSEGSSIDSQSRAPDWHVEGDLLAEAQTLVDALQDIAGVRNRLSVLLEVPPDELIVALAARLCREEQFASAEDLLTTIRAGSPPMRLRVAQLQVEIARGRNVGPTELAAALANAGDEALWSGDSSLASSHYSQSLQLRPDHPETLRSLGNALVVHVWAQKPEVARPKLLRVLELCARAAELDPIESYNWWALMVEHHAHMALSGFVDDDRGIHLWSAITAAARAVRLSPESADAWYFLANDLCTAGAFFTAEMTAQHHGVISLDGADSKELAAVTALNLSRPQLALDLLARHSASSQDSRAWIDALRGYAYRLMEEYGQAGEHLRAAQARYPQLQYRQWIAETLTENNEPEAEEHWQALWRESDLTTIEGLQAAAWAAVYQGLVQSAQELATRLACPDRLFAGERTSLLVSGIAKLWETKGHDGWEKLGAAYDRMIVLDALRPVARFIRAILLRAPVDPGTLATRLEQLIITRTTAVQELFDREDDCPAWEVELEWLAHNLGEDCVRNAVIELRKVMRIAERSGVVNHSPAEQSGSHSEADQRIPNRRLDPEPHYRGEEAAATVQVALPMSWFAGLEGQETTHDFFRRSLPDARAAEGRAGGNGAVQPGVRVRAEAECEPDQVWIGPPAAPVPVANVLKSQWYCPEPWLVGLDPERRSTAQPSTIPGLYTVAPPQDAVERMASWSSFETVARVVLRTARAS